MLYYILVFLASLLVDIIPFFGPPAWIVMVFFQLRYDLNIWIELAAGVLGSALGRYLLGLYMPWLGHKIINKQKDEDLQFLGKKMKDNFWKTQVIVLFYTMLPIPSTPLFTVVGLSRINPMRVIFAFFIGKFTSDALMVNAGIFASENLEKAWQGIISWKTLSGIAVACSFFLSYYSLTGAHYYCIKSFV